ncbi:unnamed protein product [Durusdinium trenchii]
MPEAGSPGSRGSPKGSAGSASSGAREAREAPSRRRNKQADRSSAYHEAYKKAIQEGSDQEEAKEKAIAAFHRAGSDELSLPVDVPGLVEDSSSGDAKKPDLARKGEMYRIAYERAIDRGMDPEDAKDIAKAAYHKA